MLDFRGGTQWDDPPSRYRIQNLTTLSQERKQLFKKMQHSLPLSRIWHRHSLVEKQQMLPTYQKKLKTTKTNMTMQRQPCQHVSPMKMVIFPFPC